MNNLTLPAYRLKIVTNFPGTGFYSHRPGATPVIALADHLTELDRLAALVGLVCFHNWFQHQGGAARLAPFQASI